MNQHSTLTALRDDPQNPAKMVEALLEKTSGLMIASHHTDVSLEERSHKKLPVWICRHFIKKFLPWRLEVFNSPHQILTLINKVPGYWLQGETYLTNKPRILQIFPHSKFGIDRTAGLKVMAKKFLRPKLYFLAITFEAVVRLIPNFECEKICKILGLFVKSVSPWSQ